mmetsp:Transcript_18871/g.51951  ORF Transcript_18871/g.51951 Transcript_18871/m.51951 type:complete len:112 (+) Transcript_18871:406-741(+)
MGTVVKMEMDHGNPMLGNKDSKGNGQKSPQTLEEIKSILFGRISSLLNRGQELRNSISVKENAVEKLVGQNSQLENDMKLRDLARLSQVEMLSNRNMELERQIASNGQSID